ncbi:MAG TPA: TonB-dependent receptor plug domain-containing protein [Opitutaceae bacterium]|nr:TonB-dependent receptor plug domain-containing protein [Opitutaceae bacterium]
MADETIVLSPFSVTEQTEGFRAVDTLGGARVKTKLADTPSSLSVITQSFLQDTGITNAQQLLIYTTNTEAAGLNGNFSGVAARGSGVSSNAEAGRLLNPNSINRARGLSPMDNTRNYFGSEIPWDSFNIDRVDISRGPNSFLFGVGSPSGISNYSTNAALFKDKGSAEVRFGSFGTTRESLDYNKVLLPKELAIRIDLLNDDTQYKQKPAFNHAQRAFAALRYDPKALNNESSTFKIEVNAESGRVTSNNPRELPPMDFITGYFSGGGLNKGGYDPFLLNTGQQLTGVGSFSGTGAAPAVATLNPWINAQDYHYIWPGPNAAYWYDAKTGSLLQAMTTLNGPIGISGSTIGGFPQAAGLYTSGFANFAKTVNYRTLVNGADTTASSFHGAYAGTVTYNDKSLTNPSIFDFYGKLIDGPNKEEWQNWKAYNIKVEQTLLHGRLAFQGVIDHQEFTQGQAGMFGYTEPFISVDMDAYSIRYPSWYPSLAVANPNAGRAFVAGDFGSGDNDARYVHDNYQVTANGDLRAEDIMDKDSMAARIFGHHSFTALGGLYTTKIEDRTWSGFATDTTFAALMGDPLGKISANRAIAWVSYLGPSMVSTTSPAGLNLSNVANPIWPTSGTILNFNTTWAPPAGVNAGDAWTDPSPYGGASTQANNPANYRGWSNAPVNVLNWKQNISDLYQSGSKTEQKLKSAAFMYQGHLWDDMIIPEFGWRRDTVTQTSANAPLDPSTAVASMNYAITGAGATTTTTSNSYGVTLHLPPSLRGKLPGDTDVSLYYFHGNNETPKIRYAFDASLLPNETGKTDDYGIQVDTLKGHATIRLTYFKTIDQSAQAGSGAADPLGNNGYYLYLLPAWGAADAAASGMAVAAWPAAINDWGFTGHPDDGSNTIHNLQVAAVNDWKTNFARYFPQSFFDAYGLGVNVNAVTTGNWLNVYNQPNASPITFPWYIANTGSGKINGSFPIVSQDITSKGYELEVTVRPVSNWDLTFNVSKVDAVQTALGSADSAFIQREYQFFNGPAGNLPLWGFWGGGVNTATTPYSLPPTSTLKGYFLQNIWSAYQLQTAQTNTMQPELARWNAKGITNYTFKTGSLKGFNVGGGLRWASKPILGYGISQFTDPLGNIGWIMDVKKPLYGKIEEHADLWVGYSYKLSSKLDWKIQLSISNVGESPHLVPVSVEPDGTWAQQRIEMGQTYLITNTIRF